MTSDVIASMTSPGDRLRMPTLTVHRSCVIPAPVEQVWAVVADLDGYHRHAPSLTASQVVAGAGEGARRRCVDTAGDSWEESCVRWEDHRQVVIEVDVSTYPWKLRSLLVAVRGTWSVEPAADGTTAALRFELTPRAVPGVRHLVQQLLPRFEREMDQILDSYADEILRGARPVRVTP
jgi:ribosome-associated toxin RatA of RatAB toxin-antitoxin module